MHVHRLVLMAFVGPPPTHRHQCAHGDGDPANNAVENLRWATCAENHADKLGHGTHNRGEAHPLCTVSTETVRRIRESTVDSKDLARQLGISYSHVRSIKTGVSRKWT